MWVGVDWFFDWRAMGGEIVKHKYILIGMTTFVLLIPLALTSTKGSVRRLGGARWARLHRLVYVCAITGTVHYLWAVKKDTLFPLVYLFVFVVLLGFRLWERYVGPLRLRAAARVGAQQKRPQRPCRCRRDQQTRANRRREVSRRTRSTRMPPRRRVSSRSLRRSSRPWDSRHVRRPVALASAEPSSPWRARISGCAPRAG